jgi:ribonuclease D
VRELSQTPAVSRYHADRYGRDLVAIVKRGMEIPEAELPEKNEPKPWIRDKALESRIERLKRVRDRFAKELKVDSAVLGARHILAAIATSGTLDVPNMREWQKRIMGEALLAAIEPEKKLF